MPSVLLSPSPARLAEPGFCAVSPLAGPPIWPPGLAGLFVKGDKPNRAASSREKTTMKTDKNSRTIHPVRDSAQPEQAFPDTNQSTPAVPKQERISYERWLAKYRPIKNHLDTNASFDGWMFETFGREVEFVRTQQAERIWTLVDCDGKSFICEGFHYVNRLGYFITEVAAPANRIFSIKAD